MVLPLHLLPSLLFVSLLLSVLVPLRGLDLGGGDCSDRPDQTVSDPDWLYVYDIFFVAAIFPPFVGGEIKPLSFCQSTHLVDFTLFRAATRGSPALSWPVASLRLP